MQSPCAFHFTGVTNMQGYVRLIAIAGILLSLVGCGKKTQAKEKEGKLIDQMFSEMERLAVSLESGDKTAVETSFTTLISLGNRMRTEKRTQSADKELEEQQGKLALVMQTRLVDAMGKAAKSGKFSPTDLQKIVMQFKDFGESIKPRV